jgi:GTP-binding protein YchF
LKDTNSMGFKCGIVGLPNVGKSTLFNALTRTAAAQAANYPFCTIEPNTGEVAVPDPRLKKLASIAGSKEIIPTRISFVDIAGLVRGASKGEGLGNKFLANIREVDAIVHVLRCFEDDDITHVEGRIDPVGDAETIETELMIADLESLERRTEQTRKRAAAKDKESLTVLPMMEASLKLLQDGKPVRTMLKSLAAEDLAILHGLNLLTSHPVLYVCNVSEEDAATGNAHTEAVAKMAAEQGAESIVISAAIESEVAQLPDEEASEFLSALGLDEAGLDRLIRAGYQLLDLITYFTVGPKETRAWTIASVVPRRPRPPASFTPTSNAVSSAPSPSPMTTMSRSAAKSRPRKQARRATRARNTWSRTATSSISGSTPDAGSFRPRAQSLKPGVPAGLYGPAGWSARSSAWP